MFSRHDTDFATITASLPAKGAMLTLSDDTLLETENGWAPAKDVTPGTAVATLDGGFVPVAWISRSKPSEDLTFVPTGALGNCSAMILPGDTRFGIEAPLSFDATSDMISLPAAAYCGVGGICKTDRASVTVRSLGFDTEEMIWAHTGTLLHARPMTDGFFHALRFADARAFLALHGPSHNAVAA